MALWNTVMGDELTNQISIIERSQSKLLRLIIITPWYVTNKTLHDDFKHTTSPRCYQRKRHKHHEELRVPSNAVVQSLLESV